jgi:hypothetical protein
MRYYVVLSGLVEDRPYVVAETVCDPDETNRELSLAGGLGGALALILTEDELLEEPGGAEAISAWRTQDDSGYDDHEAFLTAAVAAGERGELKPPLLRLILSPAPGPD